MAADASLPGIIATVVSDRHGLCWSGAVGAVTRGGNAVLGSVSAKLKQDGTGPLPHPATQQQYVMGGRVGERASADSAKLKTTLTPDHAFRIASVTKVFVAATALRLVEQRRLSLFAPASRWLSQRTLAALADNGHPVDAITPFQLLAHIAGLRDHGSHPDYADRVVGDPCHVWTRAEQIELAMTYGPPLAPPGKQFAYSDTGYLLIGEIIENVTGMALASAVRTLLDFDRLGLTRTFWERAEPPPERLARAGQYFGDLPVATIDPSADLFGGGGLVSTTGDLVGFLRALLRGALFAYPETLAAGLLTPAVAIGDAGHIHSALLRSTVIGGRPCWSHGGFWGVQLVHFVHADVTLALTFNQVKCDTHTSGDIGRDGLVDRLARLALAGFDR